jgi:predicted nucleic acid-binding protein
MLIVSNTSPLSNLAVIGEISLQRIYPKILIPSIVYTELICLPEIQPTIAPLITIGWLEIRTPKNLQLIQSLEQTLDPGESTAIALASELNADRLLIDERLGRSIATQYDSKFAAFWAF